MVNPTQQDNTPDQLQIGGNKWHAETFLSAGSLTFPKGMILGRITASGKLTFYAVGAVDGSQIPLGVLVNELVTVAAADYEIRAMLAGTVREDALLTWTAGVPVEPSVSVKSLLRDYGIFAEPVDELLAFDNS